ncbi:hypothetical protein CCACVL1_13922, partial [Corchorus capsularis]
KSQPLSGGILTLSFSEPIIELSRINKKTLVFSLTGIPSSR